MYATPTVGGFKTMNLMSNSLGEQDPYCILGDQPQDTTFSDKEHARLLVRLFALLSDTETPGN